MLIYILFATLSQPIQNEYEVGSEQDYLPIEKELYLSTEEPNGDINESIIKKHHTKTSKYKKKGNKYIENTNKLELEKTILSSQHTGSIVVASLGCVFIITGIIITIKNYCSRRSGYHIIKTNTGVDYGKLENVYNGE